MPETVCPKCGTNAGNNQRNCCAVGGSWAGKCGEDGEHTWNEGLQACNGETQTPRKWKYWPFLWCCYIFLYFVGMLFFTSTRKRQQFYSTTKHQRHKTMAALCAGQLLALASVIVVLLAAHGSRNVGKTLHTRGPKAVMHASSNWRQVIGKFLTIFDNFWQFLLSAFVLFLAKFGIPYISKIASLLSVHTFFTVYHALTYVERQTNSVPIVYIYAHTLAVVWSGFLFMCVYFNLLTNAILSFF